jgi:hypothetical protein
MTWLSEEEKEIDRGWNEYAQRMWAKRAAATREAVLSNILEQLTDWWGDAFDERMAMAETQVRRDLDEEIEREIGRRLPEIMAAARRDFEAGLVSRGLEALRREQVDARES